MLVMLPAPGSDRCLFPKSPEDSMLCNQPPSHFPIKSHRMSPDTWGEAVGPGGMLQSIPSSFLVPEVC